MAEGPEINPHEVLESMRRRGLDPATVTSCLPAAGSKAAIRGVKGCVSFEYCIFNQRRYSMGRPFKGEGPKNIAYYLKPEDGTPHQKEAVIACERFCHTLKPRMQTGERDRAEGKPGEIIEIIGVEGHPEHHSYQFKTWCKKDENDKRPDAEWHFKIEEREIPAWVPRQDLRPDSYESQLERRSKAREQARDLEQYGEPEPVAVSVAPTTSKEQRREGVAKDEPWVLAEPAEPAKGKK